MVLVSFEFSVFVSIEPKSRETKRTGRRFHKMWADFHLAGQSNFSFLISRLDLFIDWRNILMNTINAIYNTIKLHYLNAYSGYAIRTDEAIYRNGTNIFINISVKCPYHIVYCVCVFGFSD